MDKPDHLFTSNADSSTPWLCHVCRLEVGVHPVLGSIHLVPSDLITRETEPFTYAEYSTRTDTVTTEVICMHCGMPITSQRVPEGVRFNHAPAHVTTLPYTEDPQEIAAGLGGWLRNIVHYTPWVPSTILDTEKPSDNPDWRTHAEPKKFYTEAEMTRHLHDVLTPVFQPNLLAIAAVLHATEAVPQRQQMTFQVAEDCGFEMEFVVRVKRMGVCFGSRGSDSGSDTHRQTDRSHDHSDADNRAADMVSVPHADEESIDDRGSSEMEYPGRSSEGSKDVDESDDREHE